MNNLNNLNIRNNNTIKTIIDKYIRCISYCDILPKGIYFDCDIACNQKYSKLLKNKSKLDLLYNN